MKGNKALVGVLTAALVMGSMTLPENVGSFEFGTMFAQAAEASTSGTCGGNLTWTLDDGVLTISGTGEMEDYSSYSLAPWLEDEENQLSIVAVVIESGVTSIGDCAFYECANLKSVDIPDTVTDMGSGTFHGCTALDGVEIPEGVTYIDQGVFYGCTSLTSITIPACVDSIWDAAFYECTGLTTVIFSEGISSLGWGVFQGCTSLTSITLPESMTSIGQYSFADCSNLADIIIGSNVTSIEVAAFENTAYYSDEDNWEGDSLYLETYLLAVNTDEIDGSFLIKDGTTVIADRTFAYCTDLISVTIPDSVITIGAGAFYGCTNLENVDMGNGVIYINGGWSGGAFEYCSSLTSIDMPESVTTLGQLAFYGCTNLTSVIMGKGVTYIGDSVFDETSLADVYYTGSESEWGEIEINEYNDGLMNATIHYNTIRSGDLNRDGTIDYLDAMTALRFDAELIELTDEQLFAADVNGDGSVDSLDAILILRYDAGLIESF